MPRTDDRNALQQHLNERKDSAILLYANSVPRVLTYVALYEALVRYGYDCVLLVRANAVAKSTVTDLGVDRKVVFSINEGALPKLRNAKLLFAPETAQVEAPDGVSTVALYHSLPDTAGLYQSYLGIFQAKPTILRHFDYVVLGARPSKEHWAADQHKPFADKIFPPELLVNRRQTVDLVPGGYPKIDWLRSYIHKNKQSADCLIYSPTKSESKGSEVAEYGEEIVRRLRRNFPNYRIVVRPYPEDGAAVEQLKAVCNGCDVVLDESKTGIEYQKRAAVVVTDSSSSAVTFSLASRRASIFCNFRTFGSADTSRHLRKERVREKCGLRIFGIDDLCNSVDEVIRNRDDWKIEIGRSARDWIFEYGAASEYIASKIPVFEQRETHADFLPVSRSPWMGIGEMEKRQHLERLRNLWKTRNRWQNSSWNAVNEALLK